MHLTLPDSWQVRDVPDEYQAAKYIAMGPRGYLGYSPSAVVTPHWEASWKPKRP